MENTKILPRGTLLKLRDLPWRCCDEEIQEFFANNGIQVSLDRISVRQYDHFSSAIVSISNETLVKIINKQLGGAEFHGKPLPITLLKKNEETFGKKAA